ncbi:MAG: hypothetical protein AAFR90_13155, partial [Pseudomonadota bacterium]
GKYDGNNAVYEGQQAFLKPTVVLGNNVKRITLLKSFQYRQLQLWDERRKKLISFQELKCKKR